MRRFARARLSKFVAALTAATLSLSSTLSMAPAARAIEPIFTPRSAGTSASAPTVVRELRSGRTETRREFLLSDGTIRAEYYAAPIFSRSATGALMPIDPSFEDTISAETTISVSHGAGFTLKVPASPSEGWVTVDEAGAAVMLRPAERVGSRTAHVFAGTHAVDASATIRSYPRVFEDADLSYEALSTGMKESITLSAPTSSTVYSFDLALKNLAPRLQSDGSIALLRADDGSSEMTIPAPVMWDARGGMSGSVHYELSGKAPLWRLDVVADADWVSSPERTFPVTIDPSVVTTGAGVDTYVSSAYPTTNYCTQSYWSALKLREWVLSPSVYNMQ